jgi:hypothetical protein
MQQLDILGIRILIFVEMLDPDSYINKVLQIRDPVLF